MLCVHTEAPRWQKLLTIKIAQQYPDYRVRPTANSDLLIERHDKNTLPGDAEADRTEAVTLSKP